MRNDPDSFEPMWQGIADRAEKDAKERDKTPPPRKAERYKRMGPAQKTHCLRGHIRTETTVDCSGTCKLCHAGWHNKESIKRRKERMRLAIVEEKTRLA